MKKALIVAVVLVFVSFAGFAQTPSPVSLPNEALAAIIGPTTGIASCTTHQSRVLFAAKRPKVSLEKALCTATANCESGTVTCQGNNNCTAVDRDCSILEKGHVTCDGLTTNCPTECCSSGTFRQQACCRCGATGECIDCCVCGGGGFAQCAKNCSF